MKIINSPSYIIECGDGKCRIGDIEVFVPENKDCIITGWHLKDGKTIKIGRIEFVPGTGLFKTYGNIVE